MINNLGYQKKLFILPFDHRSSFLKLFGFQEKLSSEQKETVIQAKTIIYEAFKKAVEKEISKNQAAILIDEEYGDKIIQDAIKNGYTVLLTTEKSGEDEFSFEYGKDFVKHIEKYKPAFTKVLIRYRQHMDCSKLKILSDYCHSNGYKFLLEVLTENKTKDEAISAIKDLQNGKVEPDVWKLEGMENEEEYREIVAQAQSQNRRSVGVVVLGRGAKQEIVENWIREGAKTKGIIGFAVGRTVFWEPLNEYKNGNIDKDKAIENICNNFLHFYHIFIDK